MMTSYGTNKRRFVVGGPFGNTMPDYYIMITDLNFWFDNEAQIYQWMDENLSRGRMHQEGMVLSFEQEKEIVLFMLRWA
jgi:hypothetical protein